MFKDFKINLILASDKKGLIGVNNKLPWRIPEDMEFFKRTTLNKVVVMGRNTFNSLPNPLVSRTNIVLTRNIKESDNTEEVKYVTSIEEAIRIANNISQKEIFIIGGSSLFEKFLPFADKVYWTKIHKDFNESGVLKETTYVDFKCIFDYTKECVIIESKDTQYYYKENLIKVFDAVAKDDDKITVSIHELQRLNHV